MFAKRYLTIFLVLMNLLLANTSLFSNQPPEDDSKEIKRHSVPSTLNENLVYHYVTTNKPVTKRDAEEKLSPFWLENEGSSPRPVFNYQESQKNFKVQPYAETSKKVENEQYWQNNPAPAKEKPGLFSPINKAQTVEEAFNRNNKAITEQITSKSNVRTGSLFAPKEENQIKEKKLEDNLKTQTIKKAKNTPDIFKKTEDFNYYMYKDKNGVIHMSNVQSDARYAQVTLQVEIQVSSGLGPKKRFTHESLKPTILKAAEIHNLDPALIAAVIKSESGFDPNAVSWAGAQGLMQLIPSTAALVGCDDPFDPEANIMGGSRYLRMMLDRFQGNVTLAVAAYNCGPGRVAKQWKVPNIKETQNYVKIVAANYEKFKEYF